LSDNSSVGLRPPTDPLEAMPADIGTSGDPRLIALDWGTSSLRAFLMGRGATILARLHADQGILRLPAPGGRAGFERAFADVAGPWLARWPGLPIVACGMVGSAQGWQEAPYVTCPVDLRTLAAQAVRVAPSPGTTLWIAPGARFDPPASAPDVMRGEEIQVAGALDGQAQWAARACFVLPGTHSKWVQVEQGHIAAIATYMTGELYAVLREHSILGRLMPVPAEADAVRRERGPAHDDAFDSGVRAAGSHLPAAPLALAHQLFAVRTLGLTGRLPPDALGDYLSGLLIGHEVAAGLAALDRPGAGAAPLVLVGEPALCQRYARALALHGARADAQLDNTAPRGLWAFARALGLLHGDRQHNQELT
jgi:2-dehydro-3-deoxygalactonokinase